MARVDRAQAVVERQDTVGQNSPDEREHQRVGRDGAQRLADILQAQMAEFPLHDIDRTDQQGHAQESGQVAKPGFQALSLASRHRQAASAWRASAVRISAIVSGIPYKATKPPKRGPSGWPSKT